MIRPALPVMRRRYPAGYWLCEHSVLPGFEAGKRYACFQVNGAMREDGGIEAAKDRSYRIYPDAEDATGWAPYWQADEGCFCYRPSELRLRYVRPFRPWEHRALVERNGLAQRVRLHDLRAQRRFEHTQARQAEWEASMQARRSHLSRAMDQVDIVMMVSTAVIAAFLSILAIAF